MAKLINHFPSYTLLFLLLLIVSTGIAKHQYYIYSLSSAPTAEAKFCQKCSKTWTGFCGISGHCDNQCKNWEGAPQAACHTVPSIAKHQYYIYSLSSAPTAEAKFCQKCSKTWTGFCGISGHCDNQCKNWEGAPQAACHTVPSSHLFLLLQIPIQHSSYASF